MPYTTPWIAELSHDRRNWCRVRKKPSRLWHRCFDGSDMVYETVVSEINTLRTENGLSRTNVNWSTPLEDLGFNSPMYIVLALRIEKRLALSNFRRDDGDQSLPALVADLVAMFEAAWLRQHHHPHI